MVPKLTLVDYKKLTEKLPYLEPFDECCGSALVETVHVEPLEGRKSSEVKRTCIVECRKCGKRYLTKWD
jgi:hypothetical protein